jgi:hypothetical protein
MGSVSELTAQDWSIIPSDGQTTLIVSLTTTAVEPMTFYVG